MRPLNDMRLPGNFDEALQLLNGRLALDGAPRYNLVVCGGTAMNATGLISRTTKDVDIVALMDDGEVLLDPAPLPLPLVDAALVVAENLGLPNDWLNNGPSSDDGGLFRLGLPAGIAKPPGLENLRGETSGWLHPPLRSDKFQIVCGCRSARWLSFRRPPHGGPDG